MTVLEAREAMEAAESEEDLAGLVEENEARIEESERVIGEALERGDLETAKREAVRLRYWVNIREGLTHWERGKEVVLQH
jgi:molecular chaperone HscB